MDPRERLLDASDAVLEHDTLEAHAALDDYWAWRKKGGFEPTLDGSPGDVFATRLGHQVGYYHALILRHLPEGETGE